MPVPSRPTTRSPVGRAPTPWAPFPPRWERSMPLAPGRTMPVPSSSGRTGPRNAGALKKPGLPAASGSNDPGPAGFHGTVAVQARRAPCPGAAKRAGDAPSCIRWWRPRPDQGTPNRDGQTGRRCRTQTNVNETETVPSRGLNCHHRCQRTVSRDGLWARRPGLHPRATNPSKSRKQVRFRPTLRFRQRSASRKHWAGNGRRRANRIPSGCGSSHGCVRPAGLKTEAGVPNRLHRMAAAMACPKPTGPSHT